MQATPMDTDTLPQEDPVAGISAMEIDSKEPVAAIAPNCQFLMGTFVDQAPLVPDKEPVHVLNGAQMGAIGTVSVLCARKGDHVIRSVLLTNHTKDTERVGYVGLHH